MPVFVCAIHNQYINSSLVFVRNVIYATCSTRTGSCLFVPVNGRYRLISELSEIAQYVPDTNRFVRCIYVKKRQEFLRSKYSGRSVRTTNSHHARGHTTQYFQNIGRRLVMVWSNKRDGRGIREEREERR